jgi:hypothetical protein
MLFEPVNQ